MIKMSEKDFGKLQTKITLKKEETVSSKHKLSLAKQAPEKLALHMDKPEKKSKNNNINVYDIIKTNRHAVIKTTISDNHVSIAIDGAKLLSINQIFAILQYRKYEMFAYKKSWHEIIKKALDDAFIEQKLIGKALPFFDTAVEVTVFRQAPKLVDEDALTTMFKYIIDGLKRNTKHNPNGILAEDNPKIVHKIECYSEKGTHCVGIRIRLIKDNKKEIFNLDKILEK